MALGDQKWHMKLRCVPEGSDCIEREGRPYCHACTFQKGRTLDARVCLRDQAQQYVFLLRVALARLLAVLRSNGKTLAYCLIMVFPRIFILVLITIVESKEFHDICLFNCVSKFPSSHSVLHKVILEALFQIIITQLSKAEEHVGNLFAH
jgi:hypothetical protein